MIENYDSLCARVLRARYHSSGDILNCELKKGSSIVWQSIWAGIQTFKKGCIWRVGDGEKINIWTDCWIPNSGSRKVITVRGNRVLSKVSELIDPSSDEWDEQLIRDNFWHIDAKRILQIPLFHQVTEDFVAWQLTRNGIFSVRPAYYKQWEETYFGDNSAAGGYGGSAPHPVWRKLWNLKLVEKIKIFVWRCLHNAIPCFSVLANRHVGNVSECPICRGAEDIKHALFTCSRARAVWKALVVEKLISDATLVDRSGAEVIDFLVCDKSTQRQFLEPIDLPELVATAGWYIWWQRRQRVRGEVVQPPVRTAPAIHALTLNFVRAAGKASTTPRLNRWSPALESQQILNVDASFCGEEYSGSCGAIVRDHRGNFISASTARLEHVADIVSAEAAPLLEGLKLIQNIGCNNVLVRMDNVTVVEALRLNEGHSMVAAPILESCRVLLREIGKVILEHCNKESNVVAHELAHWGRANNPSMWVDAPPEFISKFLADDVSVI